MYKEMVEIIYEVTRLNVPVAYNDMEANCIGSPYFDVGENCWRIIPEDEMDNPLFTIEDFLENKHLDYYYVGIPNDILKDKKSFIFDVTQESLAKQNINIPLTKKLMELYILLHEFGHAHELFVKYEGNVESYVADNYEKKTENKYLMRKYGLAGTKEGFLMHKELPTEQYADNFAMKHFEEAVNLLKERVAIC